MTITCVLFDLDNTLTDRAASISIFAKRFFADFRKTLHKSVTLNEVDQVMQIGDGGGYRPKETMFVEIQTTLQWYTTTPTIEQISTYWYTHSPKCMQLRPGTEQTLAELRQSRYRLGIVSNGKAAVQNATIDALGIREYFNTIIISETAGVRKPDPRIFHMALSLLRARPESAMFVGDHPRTDVQGARGAGLQAVWFAGAHEWPSELKPPEHQITEMAQVLKLV